MQNIAILTGRIGRKETKALKKGGEMTVISIATTKRYTDASGERHVRTTWHNINFFNKLSDIVLEYAHVGNLIIVRGEICNQKIEHGERAGQYIYSVTADEVIFLPSGKKKDDGSNEIKKDEPIGTNSNSDEFDDSDIPF